MTRFFVFISIVFLVAVAIIFVVVGGDKIFNKKSEETVLLKPINVGDTFGKLAIEAGLATSTITAIIDGVKDVYNLASIQSGKELAFVFSLADKSFKRLVYQVNTEQELIIEQATSTVGGTLPVWLGYLDSIDYEIRKKELEASIDSSLYETFIIGGWDIRLGLELSEIFAWQIDFAADIQKGDSFKVIFEERYRDGVYVMPGKILAAKFVNAGEVFRGYYFEGPSTKAGLSAEASTKAGLSAEASTKAGYYDENGNSLQKVFLKSPLQYKYISSGFSYARYNPILKKVSPHRGIDYAANAGTPAVAVGDGTVIQAGWNGYYGISATIRHNDVYKTVYGHFQSLAKGVKVGAKVKQGQVVGYVGSTGLATGPHLHYEMHKFGTYTNPFKVEVPPGEPIAESDRSEFEKIIQIFNI